MSKRNKGMPTRDNGTPSSGDDRLSQGLDEASKDAQAVCSDLAESDAAEAPREGVSSDVSRDKTGTKEVETFTKLRRDYLKQWVERFKEDNKRRGCMFYFALVAIAVIILCGIGLIFMLACRDRVGDGVYVAFFGSLTAQTIGLAFIIARYLYPSGGHDESTIPWSRGTEDTPDSSEANPSVPRRPPVRKRGQD